MGPAHLAISSETNRARYCGDLRSREYWGGLFAHGFGLCGTTHSQWVAEMEAMLGHNRGRGVGMAGHNSFEVFLTGGQALFAVAVLMSLSLNNREALLMFGLFLLQLVVPITEARFAFGALFTLLALAWFVAERRQIPMLLRTTRRELFQPAGNPGRGPPQGQG